MTTNKYDIEFLLNPNNKEVSEDIINNIFNKYKINFQVNNNIDIFIQGLTHESFSINSDNYEDLKQEFILTHKNMVFVKNYNYERLEFLGDAIIKPIISIYLVERYPYENEGFLSTLRTKIESTHTLSHFFECLGLQDYILLSQSVEQENGRNNIHILEDCFEAFIGALFKYAQLNGISYGDIMNIIQKLVNILIETELNLSELIQMKDYKGALNEYCHKEKIQLPKYIKNNITSYLQTYEGKYANEKEIYMYNVSVIVDGITYGPASDIVLKEAEQKVAKMALDALNNEDDNDDVFILNDQNKNQTDNQIEEKQDLIPNINQPFTFKPINSDKNGNIYQLDKSKLINKFGSQKNNSQFNNQFNNPRNNQQFNTIKNNQQDKNKFKNQKNNQYPNSRNNKKYQIKQQNQFMSSSAPTYINKYLNSQNKDNFLLQDSPNNSPNSYGFNTKIYNKKGNKPYNKNGFNKRFNNKNNFNQNNNHQGNYSEGNISDKSDDSDDIFIVK